MIRFFLIFFMILFIHPAYADIYKCTDNNGVVTFSDEPCGNEARVVYKGTRNSVSKEAGNDKDSVLSSVTIDGSLTKDQIYDQLKDHGRLLGRHIFKDESFAGFRKRPRNFGNKLKYNEITCYWGSRSSNNFKNYTMTIEYTRGIKPNGSLLFQPNKMTFYYKSQPHDPPSMKNMKNFKRLFHGTWRNFNNP